MSILSQHHYHPLRATNNPHSRHHRHQCLPLRVKCSTNTTTTTTTTPKPNQKPPVIGPPLATPPHETTATNRPILDDPSLESTWSHRAWVASGCTALLVSLAKCVNGAAGSNVWLKPVVAGLTGYVVADLGSGLYHWAIDNYGGASTPIFGSQIQRFQDHHKWPLRITRIGFANNLHELGRAVTFTVLPIHLASDDPTLHGFVVGFAGCVMFCQQFHAWAHERKSRLPPVVVALQDAGVLIGQSQHTAHHRPPYTNNYCIVSGVWNKFLDEKRVFEGLEMAIFFMFGVRPRSWGQPNSEEIETSPPNSSMHGQ